MNGPHQGQPIRVAGVPLEEAEAAAILVHGRGATAQSILTLVPEIAQEGFVYLAPQAANNTWYPNSFLAPIPTNEPGISSGIARLASLVEQAETAGIPAKRVMLIGFSQGACLTTEFVARHARRYGGAAGLSGGLIGPEGTPRDYDGSLDGTPIFLGCSDRDPHIPAKRVRHTQEVLERLGGNVTMRLYPNMAHTINRDEIEQIRTMMGTILSNGF
ncbi:MAG: alpha/beta hydrolase [Chloroflexota bacterium]|nr:alpha/beta hydrolase [Chloroflexota bacterium]